MWLEETINDYEMSRELGKGGFAIVQEAKRQTDGLRVACKMIDRKKLEQDTSSQYPISNLPQRINTRSASMFDRLNAEITIHHQVKHRNIVELLNCFYDENYIYLILELCSQGDLEQYLKQKRILSEAETQTIVKQVVDGLVYLHNHGIIHRDIKLSNLLLTDTFEVKIADFGLAKKIQLTREQNNETMCGTPNYISPEIASRTPHSFSTDVWSLGILIATLLTGEPPFNTDTVHGTLNKVTNEKYELPSTFSEEAQDLVNSTLRKAAELRPNILEIRDHPFFSKDFSRLSQTNPKYAIWGPAVNRSHDSGFIENLSHQRSTISTASTSNSAIKSTYTPRIFSPNSALSPCSSQKNEPIYKSRTHRTKAYENYLNHSSNQQIGQNLDSSSRYADCTYSGPTNLTDLRPTSATSSVRSQDSGVAQSDPKTSIDCSAKSETSPKVSTHNSNNYYLSHHSSSTLTRHRSPSSTNSAQHLMTTTTTNQQGENFDSNIEQLREKLQPLNTARLKPYRQATKSMIMGIMENGEVVLESIRTKSTKRRIVDVFRVSTDGLHIIIYSPNCRPGPLPLDKNPPPPIPRDKNAYQEYHFDRLPVEYWKRYQYAHKFVTLVRSRTPKITLYTPDAKCSLMETDIEFEATFLCGVKISICRENVKFDDPLKIKIMNYNDKSESLLDYDRVTAPNISAIEHFSPEIRQMIDQAIMFYKFCLSRDKLLQEWQKELPLFRAYPAQFGKRHAQLDINRPNTPSSIGRTISSKFGGSSSTINDQYAIPSSPMLSTRPDFSSETDIRKSRTSSTIPISSAFLRNHIQHSTSSSALRTSDLSSTYQVAYNPLLTNPIRSQSVHPEVRFMQTNMNHLFAKSNLKTNLTQKSIIAYPDRTFHVTFSDESVMIIREGPPDGQIFIDAQGKHYSFDRRQAHQPEAIQERLALFYQNEHEFVN